MRKANKLMLAAVLAAVTLPTGAFAADADLQVKIDKLSQQMEDLKGQVDQLQDKSLSKWLTIGGKYRFQIDSLQGQTAAYTDPMAMFNFLGQNALLTTTANIYYPNGSVAFPAGTSVGQILQIANANMAKINNYQAANQQATTFMALIGQLYGNVALNPMAAGDATKAFVPAYKPTNPTLYTSLLNIDLHAKVTQDVTAAVRLNMYKMFGNQSDSALDGNAYFADRTGVFDGTLGHTPSSSLLNVDRAYVDWENIGDQPIWFSVGRRPSTDGFPAQLRNDDERPGVGGTPALLVNYAFDGGTLGYAPDIDALPGFFAKVCYGRGFESGFSTPTNSIKDTDMLGVALVPVDTDPIRLWFQWNRGFNIFDFPAMNNTAFGNTSPKTNLGSIDWYGVGGMTTLKKVGPGDFNFFVDGGMSVTHPTQAVSAQAMFQGLMTGAPFDPERPTDKTGYAVFTGLRYDLPSKTKIGFEFNYGSKNWITFAPAAEDMWTSKVGTRGRVYEPYVIQELNLKPVSSYFSKAFFKLGYQFYDFDYTGSNNWVGAPINIHDLAAYQAQGGMLLQAPVKYAHDIYGTFEVHF